MNWLSSGIETIGNAIEINSLKDERTNISNKIDKFKNQIKKYEQMCELKEKLEANIKSNEQTIALIRTYFINENININTEDFSKNTDLTVQQMFKTFTSIQINIKSLGALINSIKSICDVDKSVYENKILELDNKFIKINEKLATVRQKQFNK